MGQVVHLTADKLVKRYDNITINCSSDIIPIVNTADIYVEKSFYNMRHHKGSCFSTALQSKCSPDICQCSSQGLWYSHSYNVTQPDGDIYIECAMVFGLKEVFSDRIRVQIVGKYTLLNDSYLGFILLPVFVFSLTIYDL